MTFYFENAWREFVDKTLKQIRAYRKQVKKVIRQVKKGVQEASFKLERELRITVAKFRDSTRRTLKEIPPMIDEAFTVDSPKKAAKMAEVYGEELATALYETQLRLEGLRNAIIRAAAPIAQAVTPLVNAAIKALTTLANTVGRIVSAFAEGVLGVKAYEKSLKSAISTTGTLQRHLAGFDQIQRLGSPEGGGLTSAFLPDVEQVIPGWEALASKLVEILKPIKELQIDFSPAIDATRKALKALEPVLNGVADGLSWVVSEILAPAIQWAAEKVLPAFIEELTQVLQTLGQVIEDVKPTLQWLWENWLQHIAQWYGDKVIAHIQSMGDGFVEMGGKVQGVIPTVETITGKIDELMDLGQSLRTDTGLWMQILERVVPIFDQLTNTSTLLPGPMGALLHILGAVADGFGGLKSNALSALEGIRDMLGGLWGFTEEKVIAPTEKGTKSFLNNIIGFFEGSISGISGAYNKLFAGLGANFQNLETVAPSIGSAARSLKFTSLSMPSIPRLAQGAVLPANKPFMAVVGDQTHGTNVEAPLATIQQALDLALNDRLEGMMAGFNAVTTRQEQILDAILGLDVSDGALHGAVKRYERRMALAGGGL